MPRHTPLQPLVRSALIGAVATLSLAAPAAAPAAAQETREARNDGGFSFEGSKDRYRTLAECRRAKNRAKARGTVAGAAVAGAGAAILGGNLGETALVAGAGALVGRELGRGSKKC